MPKSKSSKKNSTCLYLRTESWKRRKKKIEDEEKARQNDQMNAYIHATVNRLFPGF